MEKRWNVYHGNENLGLKTAKEIREALRHGSLDPFDKVALEGSNIREDLIEVDEIFREPIPDTMTETFEIEGTQISSILPLAKAMQATSSRVEAIRETPPSYTQEISYYKMNEAESAKTPAKRYYILDRDKVLGPLSALDIQALFNRGVLNKKAKVQKMGSSRGIPIAQFIANYAGDRLKELAEDGKIPNQIGVGSPSSKVLNELSRMANSQRLAQNQQTQVYFLVAGGILLAALLLTLIYARSTVKNSPTPSGKSRLSEPDDPLKDESAASPRTGQRPRLVQRLPEPAVTKPAPGAVNEAEVRRPEAVNRPTPPKLIAPPAKPQPARTEVRPKAIPRAERSTPNNASPPARKVAELSREPSRPSTPTPPAAKGPISRAVETAGRIQTIGPLSFSASALDACPAKCNLTLRDAAGTNMKAVFFKSAYYEQLKSRSKSVTLTGNTKLDAGELVLIIQDIR